VKSGDYHLLAAVGAKADQPAGGVATQPIRLLSPTQLAPNEIVYLDLTGDPADEEDTGIMVWNRHPQKTAEISLHYRLPVPSGPVEPMMELEPYGVEVQVTGVNAGDYTLLVAVDYGAGHPAPTDERVLLRLSGSTGRSVWTWPAPDPDNARGPIDGPAPWAALAARDKTTLGAWGMDPDDDYVWAVVSNCGTFGVGRRPAMLRDLEITPTGDLRIRFLSAENRAYRLLSAASLPGEWEPHPVRMPGGAELVEGFWGSGDLLEVLVDLQDARRFFRLESWLPDMP
ncbi:MAG: hypothetical protein H7A46_24970, partial [Verrucomicrobiales bacterium]|nr:hypothetical protein [Verrucomicrobiales bacterium]